MRHITVLVVGLEQTKTVPDHVELCSAEGITDAVNSLHTADGIVSAFDLPDGSVFDLLERTNTANPVVVVGGDVPSNRIIAAGAADHFSPPVESPRTAIRCAISLARARRPDSTKSGADSPLAGSSAPSPSQNPRIGPKTSDSSASTDGGRDSGRELGESLGVEQRREKLRMADNGGSGPDPNSTNATIPAEQNHGSPGLEPAVPARPPEPNLKQCGIEEAPIGITISDPELPDNPLVYVNETFEQMTGYSSEEVIGRNCRFLQGEATDPGEIQRLRKAINTRNPVTVEMVNYRQNGDQFWNRIDIAPVETDQGELYFVGYQTDVTEQKEAELAAQQRAEALCEKRQSLEHLLTRVQGLVSSVTRVVTESTSRDELEQQVCERFAAAEGYTGGWFGRREMTSNQLVARTQVACGGCEGLAVPLESDADGQDPTRRAIESGQVSIATVAELPDDSPHQRAGPSDGAVAAIPLQYGETRHGVLTVYTSDADRLDTRERTVLESLGGVTTTGINQLQSRRLLTTDEFRRLVFESSDSNLFFITLSEKLDTTLEYKGTVHGDDDGLRLAFLINDASPDAVREAVTSVNVSTANVATTFDEGCLFEFEVPTNESFLSSVIANGGSISAVSATGGVAELTVKIPVGSNVQPIVSRVLDQYPQTELISQRTEERTQATSQEFVSSVKEELTDRQLTVLRRAHISGFYEWPRNTSGKDIAESMGIDRSTFHQHLRAAEGKIVDRVLDDVDNLPIE